MAVFNYFKKGFRFQPTSFYSSPFWTKKYLTKEQNLNGPIINKCNGKPIYKISYNLIESFLNRMNEIDINLELPYIYFNILNEYTHDFMVVQQYIDAEFRNMLERFEKKGFLDNTLLIIFSDHGIYFLSIEKKGLICF